MISKKENKRTQDILKVIGTLPIFRTYVEDGISAAINIMPRVKQNSKGGGSHTKK